jgi:hypothetical protein
MNSNCTWDLIERKMLELRILTNANWKNKEYELAVMGEKVLRSVENSRFESESVRLEMLELPKIVADIKEQMSV